MVRHLRYSLHISYGQASLIPDLEVDKSFLIYFSTPRYLRRLSALG